jgi:hypothetical protein
MRASPCALAVVLLAAGAACRQGPESTAEVVATTAAEVPLDPTHAAWDRTPERLEPLLLQDLVEPRLLVPSTPALRIRALVSRAEIGFRLEWADGTVDDLPGAGRFVDGCAVQLPQRADANAPDPQMGQAGKAVEISYWRADWQATVDGRGTEIRDLYPNATIDHYPFRAPSLEPGSDAARQMERRYAPADVVGNRRGGERVSPVEDLVAEGPGSLAPAGATTARARGIRTATGWAVVIVRPLPAGLSSAGRTQAAFAVWEGAHQEAGARKMRSGWVGLSIRGTT